MRPRRRTGGGQAAAGPAVQFEIQRRVDKGAGANFIVCSTLCRRYDGPLPSGKELNMPWRCRQRYGAYNIEVTPRRSYLVR